MAGLFTTHILSLDALMTVLETVEAHCHTRIMASKYGNHGNIILSRTKLGAIISY